MSEIFSQKHIIIFLIFIWYTYFLPWIHWMAIIQNQYSLVVTFTFYVTKFWFSSQWGSRDFPRISSLKFFTIFSTVNSYFFLYKNIVLVLVQFPKVTVSIRLLLHTFCAYHVTRRYIVRQKRLLEKNNVFYTV